MTAPSAPQASSIRYLKGVGPKRAQALEKFGIYTLRDLLYLFPRRYEDRGQFKSIFHLTPGETVSFRAEILKVTLKRLRGRMTILEVLLGDDTGVIPAVWFNQPYLKDNFQQGRQGIFFGKIDFYQNKLQLSSPEYEILEEGEEAVHTGRITPVYPLTEGLFQRSLRNTLSELVGTQLAGCIKDPYPESFRETHKIMELKEAIAEMHFPGSFEKLAEARRRIVFDEFFIFELTLLKKMENMKSRYRARRIHEKPEFIDAFESKFPFKLTKGQRQALHELIQDLDTEIPMNRLIQGDVGSGKTLIAAFAALAAAKNNMQAALLVPTEILAEQHFRSLKEILEPFKIEPALLTASTKDQKRERLVAELKQNKIPIVIGTHALLQEDVQFHSLALIIIDEQHKFGVHQRAKLLNREPRPHQLVMTATPIPRTLALTVYGDLSVSYIRELPAGRKPIKTFWISRAKQEEVLRHIREKIEQGQQAYFLFPLIEETEKMDLLAAAKEFERLKKGAFKDIPMGLVHGRLPNEERDRTMVAFKNNEIKILVATSVIEVGVNNPNATIMVIENAERFGLSQLHQMRGRIGRGDQESECFLFGEPKTEEGQKRLRILTKTQDGFIIAEEDLKLRGPGDFWGTRQSGEPLFKVGNPITDPEILFEARDAAQDLLQTKALERDPQWLPLKNFLEQLPVQY